MSNLDRRLTPILRVGPADQHLCRAFGLSGYRDMLVGDFDDIPDLRCNFQLLVCDRRVNSEANGRF